MAKTRLGVFFGGISVEHDVSVITGVQLMNHADAEKYDVIPVYVDKSGTWWTGDVLKDIAWYKTQNLMSPKDLTPFSLAMNRQPQPLDAALLCFHGAYGEAGNVQGVLEIAGIPYQGPGVTGSAVAFDKIMTRQILAAEKIAQPEFLWFSEGEWIASSAELKTKSAALGYPLFVKPANGGSTIGVQKVGNDVELEQAVSTILTFDSRIIVEKAVVDCLEINVSVVGYDTDVQASVAEQPINHDEFLSFADKYERGGKKSGMASASRRIPAPISQALTTKVQELAKRLFHLFDCSGVVRIDFFVNPTTEDVFVTELNTIPGSMSFYLWEASGMPYASLIDTLVEIAQTKHHRRTAYTTTFSSSILESAKA